MWLPLLALVVSMQVKSLDIQVDLLAHQMEFMAVRTGVTALTGGYGSGKSSSCALKGITHTQWDPGILHAICSPSFPMAKLTIIPSIFEVLEDWMGLKEDRDFTYNRTDHIFDFFLWGGKLVVLSGEEPKRLKGPNLGSFGIDEPGLQSHAVFKQCRARVRHPRARFREIYLTGTPEDLNWYFELVEGNLKPQGLCDIRAHSRDNFFLPEDYFKGLEDSYSETEVKAYMAGQFVNLTADQAYHAYTTSNLIEAAEFGQPDPSLPLLIGFDFNWKPNCAVLAQEVPDWVSVPGAQPERKLVIFDEVAEMTRTSTERKCEIILDKYGTDFEYKIYQDSAGKADNARTVGASDLALVQNTFKSYGAHHHIFYPSANPKRKDRLNAVNGRLCNARGERFALITKNCKNLIADLRKVEREEYLAGNFKDKRLGHITDALSYLIHYRYPVRRRINHSNRAVV